mgnify:CR=1 FL=1
MKKSLALLVSLILVVGLFAGCGTTDAAAKAESAPDYYAATGLYYTCLDLQAKVPEGIKVGRNEPCPCGSGKKYKKCCGKN